MVVGVAVEDDEPRVLLSTFLATGAEGDRLSLEPYRVAHELARGPQGGASAEAAAAVAEGRDARINSRRRACRISFVSWTKRQPSRRCSSIALAGSPTF